MRLTKEEFIALSSHLYEKMTSQLSLIHISRLYGSRSHKNKQIVEELQKVAKDLK